MAKANRKIRDKALGGVNWWTYITSLRPKGHRNEPQYIDKDDVIKARRLNKIADKLVKKRKREEKRRLNIAKHLPKLLKKKKIKVDKLAEQIQYGFDLAKWWNEQHE